MFNIGSLPVKRCGNCRRWFIRWISIEELYDGQMITVQTPLIGKGFCYPCFTVENLKLDVEIARAEIGTPVRGDLLEMLAALEHAQWVKWSMELADKEFITKERRERWESLWVPYEQLSEEMKEFDREWARKVLEVVG